ncbi:g2156 [Coccomyxa viridis]|uniref:Phospholipase B-like n=1 Tax=Coccomyxa viridis TaxID=1274662 RepID=A0ABP1FNL2_9CHLO
MRAAGYLEGVLTAYEISAHHLNMESFFDIKTEAPAQWLLEQDAWSREQVAANKSDFWATLGLLLDQHSGMMEGYWAAANDSASRDGETLPQMSVADFLKLSAVGDLGDLIPALEPRRRVQWNELAADDLELQLASMGHCSALVKVTGNYSDLLMAHSSWFTYSGMVRIYKEFNLALHSKQHVQKRAVFSSYPGELSSDDNFYISDTGLALLQTTNDVLDTELYKLLTPHSVLNWQRVRIANAMATSGREWAELIAFNNSGTYCNQYMVVDLKLFSPGEELQPDLLWVIEQIPGLTVAADQTDVLARGYWPSYNVPFYPEIYRRAGYKAFMQRQQQRGADFVQAAKQKSYQLAPRATIFRRDAGDVDDLASLKRLMRSNSYSTDPYSDGNSLNAICGRGDLSADKPRAYGCYDTKVASFRMAQQLLAEGIVGPAGQKPFSWSGAAPSLQKASHVGEADEFAFSFELLQSSQMGDDKQLSGTARGMPASSR